MAFNLYKSQEVTIKNAKCRNIWGDCGFIHGTSFHTGLLGTTGSFFALKISIL